MCKNTIFYRTPAMVASGSVEVLGKLGHATNLVSPITAAKQYFY